jgi:hypothetical protein
MGIHSYTDETNRLSVVMTDTMGCSCAVEGEAPFLRVIDDRGNRISLQLPNGLARSLQKTWAETILSDAADGAGC